MGDNISVTDDTNLDINSNNILNNYTTLTQLQKKILKLCLWSCLSIDCCCLLQVVEAVKGIIYPSEDCRNESETNTFSPIAELPEMESSSIDTHKRKRIDDPDQVDAASLKALSQRHRTSSASDVHCNGLPLMT